MSTEPIVIALDIGGTFTDFGGVASVNVARLQAGVGTPDNTFVTPGTGPNAAVRAVAVDTSDNVIIGGDFTTLTPNGTDPTKWTQRFYLARVNTDGTVDTAFDLKLNEQPGNSVTNLALQSDGKLLIAGGFSSLQAIGATARTTVRSERSAGCAWRAWMSARILSRSDSSRPSAPAGNARRHSGS